MKQFKAFAMIATIAGALISLGGTNNAGASELCHPPGFGNMSSANHFSPQIRKLSRALDLTTSQETQVQSIVTAEQLAVQPIETNIASDYALLAADTILLPLDEAMITAAANQLGTDIASLKASEAEAENQIYALLSTEQQTLFVKIRGLFRSIFEQQRH